ncbi:MAG: tRNA preQ1(34) S-adenosylmethionine ribosyltransferase-isomerase QueA [Phycisphaerales bacterium]
MTALPTQALDYPFDERFIAAQAAEPRDSARLMVVHRADGRVEHRRVRDLPEYLGAGDRLVLNRTAVRRARFMGRRVTGTRVTEGLFLDPTGDGCWNALVKHSNRFHAGDLLRLIDPHGHETQDHVRLIERAGDGWKVRIEGPGSADAVFERSGWTPLPPYIRRARGGDEASAGDAEARDHARYQTVYARPEAVGSVAAPTAGLHFTQPLLQSLRARGVQELELLLDVGAGTFKPVETPTLAEHRMHREHFSVPAATLAALRALAPERAAGRARLVVVGTTTVRALESLPDPLPAADTDLDGSTEILIAPGHRFRFVDALMTNFHLPRSTLLALVGALVGLERLKELYALAQHEGYRFYSYGDAMLIL